MIRHLIQESVSIDTKSGFPLKLLRVRFIKLMRAFLDLITDLAIRSCYVDEKDKPWS